MVQGLCVDPDSTRHLQQLRNARPVYSVAKTRPMSAQHSYQQSCLLTSRQVLLRGAHTQKLILAWPISTASASAKALANGFGHMRHLRNPVSELLLQALVTRRTIHQQAKWVNHLLVTQISNGTPATGNRLRYLFGRTPLEEGGDGGWLRQWRILSSQIRPCLVNLWPETDEDHGPEDSYPNIPQQLV